jgi:hypothetical protein
MTGLDFSLVIAIKPKAKEKNVLLSPYFHFAVNRNISRKKLDCPSSLANSPLHHAIRDCRKLQTTTLENSQMAL